MLTACIGLILDYLNSMQCIALSPRQRLLLIHTPRAPPPYPYHPTPHPPPPVHLYIIITYYESMTYIIKLLFVFFLL